MSNIILLDVHEATHYISCKSYYLIPQGIAYAHRHRHLIYIVWLLVKAIYTEYTVCIPDKMTSKWNKGWRVFVRGWG